MPISDSGYFSFQAYQVLKVIRLGFILTLSMTLVAVSLSYVYRELVSGEKKELAIFVSEPFRKAIVNLEPHRSAVLTGELFKIKVILDSAAPLSSASAIIKFPSRIFDIETVYFSDFATETDIALDSKSGAVKLSSKFESAFLGRNQWAEIIFKAKNASQASIQIDCLPGSRESTILVDNEGNNVVDCSVSAASHSVVNSVLSDSKYATSICSQIPPQAPRMVIAQPGPGIGEVTLTWESATTATFFSIFYGETLQNYPFGIPHIEDKGRFVVSNLIPGQEYFFVVNATNVCAVSNFSSVATSTAGYGTITKESTLSGKARFPIPLNLIPEEATQAVKTLVNQVSTNPQENGNAVQKIPGQQERYNVPLAKNPFNDGIFWLVFLGMFVIVLALVILLRKIPQNFSNKDYFYIDKI